jgi:urease accessory protein UreE
MKPYILNYSETIEIKKTISRCALKTQINTKLNVDFTSGTRIIDSDEIIASSTKETFTIEASDSDEFHVYDSTYCTESIEPSDNDEIAFMSDTTLITKAIESSDNDEIYLC